MGKAIERKASKRDIELLYECAKIAHEGVQKGNHPFGALLADNDGNILIRQGNEFTEGGSSYHAETLLVLKAAKKYSPEFLKDCTLYTNFEPCCMCTGAIYWANIGRICFCATERTLLSYTGSNDENPTFSLSCRSVIEAGQKEIAVTGPVDDEDLVKALVKDHIGFWK